MCFKGVPLITGFLSGYLGPTQSSFLCFKNFMAPVLKQGEVSVQQDRSTLSVPCCAPAYNFSSFCSKGRDLELQIILRAVWRNIYPLLKAFLQVPASLLEKGGLTPEQPPEDSLAAELQDMLYFSRAASPFHCKHSVKKQAVLTPKVWRKGDAFSAGRLLIFIWRVRWDNKCHSYSQGKRRLCPMKQQTDANTPWWAGS